MGKGLLLTILEQPEAGGTGLRQWIEAGYHSKLASLDGVLRGRLWSVEGNPRLAITVLDLESPDTLNTQAFAALKETLANDPHMTACGLRLRFEGEQLNPGDQLSPAEAGGMLVVASNALPDFAGEYGRWYDEEHLPALRAVPGALSARRFRATQSSHGSLSLYHLETPGVQASAAWKKATDTPWSSRVRPQVRDRLRFVCQPWIN